MALRVDTSGTTAMYLFSEQELLAVQEDLRALTEKVEKARSVIQTMKEWNESVYEGFSSSITDALEALLTELTPPTPAVPEVTK